jgi:hypothetical protein
MSDAQTTSALAVFGRITWMMLGPLALAAAVFGIITSGSGWATGTDLFYFIVLGLMILGRWLEFRGGNPQTGSGEPATPEMLPRYVFFALMIGLSVWVVANVIGNHLL